MASATILETAMSKSTGALSSGGSARASEDLACLLSKA